MKVSRLWVRWAMPWVMWTAISTVGGLIGYITLAAVGLGSAFYDPDEVEAFLRTTTATRLAQALIAGAMVGLLLGLFVGGIRWLLSKNLRDALKAAALALSATMLLCLVTGTGGPSELQHDTVEALRYGFAGGLVGGTLTGLAQWLYLRLWLGSDADGWAAVTALLWAVTWAIGAAALKLEEGASVLRWLLSEALVLALGALVGAGQWIVLRRIAQRAGWWIAASGLSAVLALGAIAVTQSDWAILTGGAALGAGTGAALLWLLPERRATEET